MKTLMLLAILALLPGCKELLDSIENSKPDPKREIFPMNDTWTWTYQVTTFGNATFGSACRPGSVVRQAKGTVTRQNLVGTLLPTLCQSAVETVAYRVSGDSVYYWNGAEWTTYVEAPLTEGRKFYSGVQGYTWQRPPKVTVPAGTYRDCWTKKHDRSDSQETFCRGVGLVSAYQLDAFGNGWKAVLDRATGPAAPVQAVSKTPRP